MKAAVFLVVTILGSLAFATSPGLAAEGSASFRFAEQSSGGHSVVVTDVSLSEGGFVAIHDATLLTKADPLGSVIGVSEFLAAGSHGRVVVYLARALAGANETLVAMPHKDTNANHIYNFVSSAGKDDGPYTGGPNALAGLTGSLEGFNGISATPHVVNNTASLWSANQTQSGTTFIIDMVDLSQPGYVAIHDSTLVANAGASGVNTSNLFTSVVGESDLLSAGVHHDVVVQVGHNCGGCTPHTNVSGVVIPMLHKETNNNTSYDFITTNGTQDGPFLGQAGSPLSAVLNVISVKLGSDARTVFPSQATGGHAVIVPEAFLPEGGFIAIHDGTLVSSGDPLGSVRGISDKLLPGVHRNVTVNLSTTNTGARNGALNASDTLYAMPHKDTNANGKYDFVTTKGADDGPYTGGPNALAGLSGALAGFNGISTVAGNATLSASVRLAANQFSNDGKSVTVEWADVSNASFIALHDASLLADVGANVLTSVVGVSNLLQPGLHADLSIPIGNNCAGCVKTHALNTSQTLIAMPHKDSNANGVYDFITSKGADDGPIVGAASNANVATANSIVVGVGFVTTPITTASSAANNTGNTTGSGNSTGSGNTTGTGNTTGSGNTTGTGNTNGTTNRSTTPPVTSTPSEAVSRSVPAPGIVLVLAGLAIAFLAMRKRKA